MFRNSVNGKELLEKLDLEFSQAQNIPGLKVLFLVSSSQSRL